MPRLANGMVEATDVVHSLGRPTFLQEANANGHPAVEEAYLGKRKIIQDWFYRNSFQTSILQSLRGEGGASPNSFIQSYTLASENLPESGQGNVVHSNVVQTTIVSNLTPGKNEPLVGGNLEESGEPLEQYPFTTRFEGVRRRHLIEFPEYKSRETLTKLLIDQIEVVKQAYTTVTAEEIEENLFRSLTAGYDAGINGAMPLACRTVVGLAPAKGVNSYVWGSNISMVDAIEECYDRGCNANAFTPEFKMSVAHIRRLRDYARFNPFRSMKVGAGKIQGGVLPYDQKSRYIFLIDQAAREALLAEDFFKDVYLRNARSLREDSLINPITFGDYMGTIFDVDVYHCPQIDQYRDQGILMPNLPKALSYGVFLGASALIEGYGYTDFIETTEKRSGRRTELVYEYVHGAEAPRFPARFSTLYNERDTNGADISTSAGIIPMFHNSTVSYGMPEVGIIHSITLNKKDIANWTV